MKISKEEALEYHSQGRRGKIEVVATKPCLTSRDLSLAYTPGVAEPCREIAKNDDDVYKYTAKGNLVAVVSNGTAVLGLGDIGPHAGKPVMEGKGVLFKRFADIDVFDIELKSKDPKEIIRAVQLLEPTFGGINLEDIKAPECFEIEETLKETMNIPVFHDDQHGTAIISCAALINAAEVAGKKLEDLKIVVNGAGAAAIAPRRRRGTGASRHARDVRPAQLHPAEHGRAGAPGHGGAAVRDGRWRPGRRPGPVRRRTRRWDRARARAGARAGRRR